jgi:two-component system NtrC family sensor kinase
MNRRSNQGMKNQQRISQGHRSAQNGGIDGSLPAKKNGAIARGPLGSAASSEIPGKSEELAALTSLAGHIAHEINNPLEYITNYLYLLSDSLPEGFKGRDYLDKIEKGIGNLAALARSLLELSRAADAEFHPLNALKTLDEAIEAFQRLLRERNVRLLKNYQCPDCTVSGSEPMLRQVFSSVIENALDAMAGDAGTLSITVSRGNAMLFLEFSDTGSGISEENLEKLFTPFFTTKKSIEKRGTGLGLVLCYNFIMRHQGAIRVASTAGEGTTVTITLPLLGRG